MLSATGTALSAILSIAVMAAVLASSTPLLFVESKPNIVSQSLAKPSSSPLAASLLKMLVALVCLFVTSSTLVLP